MHTAEDKGFISTLVDRAVLVKWSIESNGEYEYEHEYSIREYTKITLIIIM